MDESFTPKQKSLWLSSSARLNLGGRVSCVHSFDCWTRGKIDWFQLNQINKIGAPDVGAPNVGRRRPDRVCRLLSQFAKKNQMKPAECVQNRNNARIYCFLPDEFFRVAAIARFHCLLVHFPFFGLAPLLPIMSK